MSKKKFLDLTGLKKYHEGVTDALSKKADKDELPKITQSINKYTNNTWVPTVGATDEAYVRKDSAIDNVELLNILD